MNNKECLYNVFLNTGMIRMTGTEVDLTYPDAWDYYTDVIDHSEWCGRDECVRARETVPDNIWTTDPFLTTDAGAPPF